MTDEEWLDELSSVVNSKGKGFCDKVAPGESFSPCPLHSNPSLMCGNCRFTLVIFHEADRLIRLARKGLAAEKAVDDVRYGRLSASEALAAYEAATKGESK